jgi:hypothetical protein
MVEKWTTKPPNFSGGFFNWKKEVQKKQLSILKKFNRREK